MKNSKRGMDVESLRGVIKNAIKQLTHLLPDRLYISLFYYLKMRKRLNWNNPETFNEKLQWLKIYDRKEIYTTMVDKYAVKEYVASQIGEAYIIPTLGVWDSFDEIDFDSLPDQFVLKCTHDSGGLAICRDKSAFDKASAKKKIERSLKCNYYYGSREWPYKNVKPRIIAEEFLSNLDGKETVEYKIFCFNGTAKMVLVCKGQAHGSGRTNDFCDLELNRFPFTSLNPNSEEKLVKPEQLSEIIGVAEKLAKDIPQVRVDTYLTNGKVYFGEMTFFHNAGFCKIEPEEWDYELGRWIQLPSKQ